MISDLFKKKELTQKELKEREYRKEIKKIRRKLWKNPLRMDELMKESLALMDKAVIDGVMTEKEHQKTTEQLNKDMEKATKIMNAFRR